MANLSSLTLIKLLLSFLTLLVGFFSSIGIGILLNGVLIPNLLMDWVAVRLAQLGDKA